MWQAAADSPYDPEFKAKGDEIQKLSVIETLPQLLAEDAHSCITRVLPKIQQSLPTASTEFHMATSVIFKQVLERRLVSPTTFTEIFLQSILSSLESRETVISHAWLETILEVIELLPVDIVKREILPIAVNVGQISQSVNSRIMCCRLMGKIATRFDTASVKKEILPTVQSLCEDVNNDVRACICLQLRYVAESMRDDIVRLLPLLVELANDEESNVRQAAVQTIGHLLPQLQPNTIKDIIVPLVKIICEKAVKTEDNVICGIAQEFGKLAQSSETYLSPAEKTWFLKYFIQLAQMGSPTNEESKQEFPFVISNNIQLNDRSVECRRNCAFNIPAMFLFATSTQDGVNMLLPMFRNLANDSYFMVRRTIACSLHEVLKVLGSRSGLIKNEIVKLLKDDNEEVLQGLVPHLSEIFQLLLQNQIIGVDQPESSTLDLGIALIKCEAEVSSSKNWRLSGLMMNQLEILPNCYSSDFIYTYFVPIVTNRVLHARPLPVRLAAGRTLLIFLRCNTKTEHRIQIRNRICTEFAHNPSCYTRMVFIRMMVEAMSIYSSVYFKKHFCSALLSLMEDPVANVRLKVITLVPTVKSCLRLPADKKLLTTLESNVNNLMSNEKDRDVSAALIDTARQLENIEVRIDSQPSPTKLSRYDSDDIKKYEEEKKLDAVTTGKANVSSQVKKPNIVKMPANTTRSPSLGTDSSIRSSNRGKPQGSKPRPALVRQNALNTEYSSDHSKASTSSDNLSSNWSRFTSSDSQLSQPWERATTSCHNTNLTSTNPSYNTSSDYSAQKVQCSCYELADRIFRTKSTTKPHEQSYRTDAPHCSCLNGSKYLKTTSLFYSKPDYRLPELTKPSILTSVRDDKHDILQDLILTRSSFASKYRMPSFDGVQPHYYPYWSFSSLPETPVTFVDDEFMVDAGIRMPSQLVASQSTSKVPNLRDIIYRNERLSSVEQLRRYAFDKSKSLSFGTSMRSSLDYGNSSNSALPTSSSSSSASGNNRDSKYSSAGERPKRLSAFDVNHNQGLSSKIPVRSIHISGSRTAPVTRTSSPIRVDSELFRKLSYNSGESYTPSRERRLRRFRSSDVEDDKLYQKF